MNAFGPRGGGNSRTPRVPMTAASDMRRSMPASAPARLDIADAAVVSLTAEQRRLERLGLEWPLARAAREIRYWRFVRALCAIAAEAA
jgi:hypothetical protein